MEKEGPPQPLVYQPVMATAPTMPVGEAVPGYHQPQQDPYAVDHTTMAAALPPYQPVNQTQHAMHGFSAPLLQQPPGYQAQGYPAPIYPGIEYVQQPQPTQAANIVVVTQPVAPTIVQPQPQSDTPIVGLVFSIVMIFACLMFGNILALSCLIPALIVASVGVASNDNAKKTKFGNASLIINVVNVIFWVVVFVAVPIITVAAVVVSSTNR